MSSYISIILGSIFINNYVLAQFLGICPTLGVSKKLDTSVGMGLAVTFVITLSSVITLLLNNYILVPFGLQYLKTIAFILVIASLVQFVEMFLKKTSPSLYNALGVFLPLITTNCVVLGVAILNVDSGYNILETVANSISASVGFTIALVLLSAIREKYEVLDVPKSFRGVPIALISLGLMSIAFFGFRGLI
ncbi:MAG: electron transport complex subunit RsxA [Tissierellia bacterium]|nr:electron transport complex subunit RsxA [Tissierellia bacterium]